MGGEDRLDRIVALLEKTRPDVVVLQECLGWQENGMLRRVADAIGVPSNGAHAILGLARPRGSGRRFHVALLSRFTILAARTHADPAAVGHAIVEATLDAPGGPVSVLGTHFDSHGEDERLRDARTAIAIAGDRTSRERMILAGDLNALSRRDPYPADLDRLLLAAGTEKYGHPARFETMPLLESAGWIDLLRREGDAPPARWVTAVRDRGGVHIEYRTDYVLASPLLAPACTRIEVLACDGASDHEPVLGTFT